MKASLEHQTLFSGKKLVKKKALGLFFAAAVCQVVAAPLDALLTATPEQLAPNGYLELGSDHMSQQLDFFKIRDTDALVAGTQAGDYRGAHVVGGWRMRDNVWLSGGLWQRKINGLSENYDFNSWQVSGLYRFMEADGKLPAMAFRASAWGNRANDVQANNICAAPVANDPAACQDNAFLNSVKISSPADKAFQVDLIGTWKLTPATDFSVMLGAGSTLLSYGQVTANMTRTNGRNYDLSFIGNDIFGATADEQFTFRDQASEYGIDLAKELAWRGNFVQIGFNGAWSSGPWTLRGGYLYYAIQRKGIDDILAARGWSSFKQSKTLLLEANYRFNPRVSAFVRGQLSNSLIFNDMPVLYNSYSADLFGGRYSIYSVGLRADF